jgi:hypothetical protein
MAREGSHGTRMELAMAARSLMARAKELLEKRAGAAMVIVPLAMAVPAAAGTVSFVYVDQHDGGSSITSSDGTSGGNFGHIFATPQDDGILLTGDSMPVALPTQYLPASLAFTEVGFVNNLGGVPFDGVDPYYLPGLPTINYIWTGGFAPGSVFDASIPLSLQYAINFQEDPAKTSSQPFGSLYWILDVEIDDNSGTSVASSVTPLTESNGTMSPVTLTVPLSEGGAADDWSWTANLIVQWDSPSTDGVNPSNPDDQLSISPSITLSTDGVSDERDPGSSTPLPPILWSGAILLTLWGAGWHGWQSFKNRNIYGAFKRPCLPQ